MPASEHTVDHELRTAATDRGDALFLRCAGAELTFGDLDAATARVANGLAELGTRRGTHVGLLMGNGLPFVLAWLGAARIGAPVVPVNSGLKGDGLAHVLDHADVELVVTEGELTPAMTDLRDRLPKVATVVSTGDVPGTVPWTRLQHGDAGAPDVDVTADDLMMLMYTSGTTGLPKGVMIPQRRIMGGRTLLTWAGHGPDDRFYTCLPLFHANAAFISFWGAFGLGAPLTLARRFSASRLWEDLREARATSFNALGAMVSIIWKQPPRPDDADNPVRRVLSAACPKDIWEPFEKRFGLDIFEFYGTVEGGLTIAGPDTPVGSIGRAAPGTEVQIVRDDGTECEAGEVGELLSRPTGAAATVAYYKDAEASAAKTRDGWLHTGDRAYADERGNLWYVDRGDHFMRRRGENVSSTEVEAVVEAHPAVLECAAYGLPSELGEDDIAVAVVATPGKAIDARQLHDFCTRRMADFQVPRFVRVMDALPKTETHRAKKVQLRTEGVTADMWDSATLRTA